MYFKWTSVEKTVQIRNRKKLIDYAKVVLHSLQLEPFFDSSIRSKLQSRHIASDIHPTSAFQIVHFVCSYKQYGTFRWNEFGLRCAGFFYHAFLFA